MGGRPHRPPPRPPRRSRPRAFLLALGALVALLLVPVAAASAVQEVDQASIDHVEPGNGEIRVLFSVPAGAAVDLGSVQVEINGEQVDASAVPAGEAAQQVRRTTILAIDTSNSMRGQRFAEAKQAALAFLSAVPDDVYVGIVSFAGEVELAQAPTLDRAATTDVIAALRLTKQTMLYDGVLEAVAAAGTEGQRSVLVLSDGRDTSATVLDDVIAAIAEAEVKVDVVALEQAGRALRPLRALAEAGKGVVLSAADPAALSAAFSSEADALARQVLVSASVPESQPGNEASVSVTLAAGENSYSDDAFVAVRAGSPDEQGAGGPGALLEASSSSIAIPEPVMIGAIVALGLGLIILVVQGIALAGPHKEKPSTLEDRIGAYGAAGTARSSSADRAHHPREHHSVGDQARDVARKALSNNRGMESRIAARLEAGGMSVKPAEWLLLHAGIAVGAGMLGLLLSTGNILVTLLFLVLGIVIPWIYLGWKKSQRLKAFNAGLADTLQLMAGSLSAGLSLAQSVDTIVREGTEPIAGEFRRVLVEARLGVSLEDALEAVGQRMESKDFTWVVMAIRIQREVGGNLSELLLTVAATLREREYLRRQVSALSAEGRLSCWVLGGLPPVFLLYLVLTKPDYVSPMFNEPVGWLMLIAMGVLLTVGIFWMSKVAKVEV